MTIFQSFHGFFLQHGAVLWAAGALLLLLAIGFAGAPLIVWAIAGAVILVGFGAPVWLLIAYAAVMALFLIAPVRRVLFSSLVMKVLGPAMPTISETERTAIESGAVWAEGELFSGKPDFAKLMAESYPALTAEEQAFLDGPVEELCASIDDWEVWEKRELPKHAWEIIRRERFLGMIIPKEFGGLGFSALAHSEVILKLASRSIPACITVMVPNSLGPAELLMHYGTDEQKQRLLPRLASGEDIPAFALTEPGAGSDAGSITSHGTLFRGNDGKLYLRLNWNKRYITLAAISTLLGMAFRLSDPENLLGKGEDLGITCALIPTNTAGVVIGRRHDPLGVPFYNCPTQGHDVVVSVDAGLRDLSAFRRVRWVKAERGGNGRGFAVDVGRLGLAQRTRSVGRRCGRWFGGGPPAPRAGGHGDDARVAQARTPGCRSTPAMHVRPALPCTPLDQPRSINRDREWNFRGDIDGDDYRN